MNELIGKQVQVLDKGYIELQSVMGDDLSIVNAARTSFLGESKGEEKDKKLLRYLMKHRHTTPFEMVHFKFRIRAPVVVWWQWVRHRTQSFNLQSGRYVAFDEDDFYIPDYWRRQSKTNKQASEGAIDFVGNGFSNEDYLTNKLINHYEVSYSLYEHALSLSVAREQARLFLPAWGSYYTGIISVNAHNLMHFLKLRMADDAQWEIRQYADVIYHEFFKKLLPVTAQAFEDYRL